MPTVKTRQTDWTAGEWSPTLGGRVDVDKYGHGADRIENFLLTQGGGLRRRPGSRFQGIAAGQARLTAFVFAEGEAYTLEWTEHLVRFYTSNGRVESSPGVPVEVVHPYFLDELDELKWTQSGDVLLLAHPAHPPARLERLTADGMLWRFRDVPFNPPPSLEFGHRPAVVGATLTPSALTGTITLTASAGIFLDADLGRHVIVLAGPNVGAEARITVPTSPTVVTAEVIEPWTTLAPTPATDWKIAGSPLTDVTPSALGPVGAPVTLTLGGTGWRVGDVGKVVLVHGGTFRIDSLVSALVVNATVLSLATAITAAPGASWTLEEDAFSPLNGYPAVVAFAEDRLWYFATPAQPQTGWASKSSDFFNFAQGVQADDSLIFTLNSDQVNPIRWALPYGRGLMLGSAGEEWVIDAGEGETLTPQTIAQAVKPTTTYGSTGLVRPLKIGNVVLFVTRSRRKLRELAPDPNAITASTYVAPDMTLLADHLTTPAKINSVKQNRRFIDLAWQREPNQTVWAVREDGTLLSFSYVREQNVTGWCRHILNPAFTLDEDGRQIPSATDGRVESVCVIPHIQADRDQVWLSVARTVGGVLVRHVESLEDQGVIFEDGFTMDATVEYDGQVHNATLTISAESGLGVNFTTSIPFWNPTMVGREVRHLSSGARAVITTYLTPTLVTVDIIRAFTGLSPVIAEGQWGLTLDVIGGLDHLEGRIVSIVGDGAVYPAQVVVGGAVFLVEGPPAVKIESGLSYMSRLRTLRPEIAGLGTIQGRPKRNVQIFIRVYKSVGCSVNGKVIPFRRGADPLGTGTPPFSGDKDVTNLGWSTEGRIDVDQPEPLPLTLLGIFPLLATDD